MHGYLLSSQTARAGRRAPGRGRATAAGRVAGSGGEGDMALSKSKSPAIAIHLESPVESEVYGEGRGSTGSFSRPDRSTGQKFDRGGAE